MDFEYDIALSYASENTDIVENVYQYLKAEGIKVFFAPSQEAQRILSGENQRQIFYKIFGIKSNFVALFVSESYVKKSVPMEEATIALSKHEDKGTVVPVYLDGTNLPDDLTNHGAINYFRSNNPAAIATHLAKKINQK